MAACGGHEKLVRILIDAGATIDLRDAESLTPLIYAVRNNRFETVKLLVNAGCSINAADSAGCTSLASVDNLELARFLIDNHADVNLADDGGMTALYRAVGRGDLETTKLLIDARSDVNHALRGGYTALIAAAEHSHGEIIKVLIDAGSNINAKTDQGATALIFAIQSGSLETTEQLIVAGADVNVSTEGGKTTLFVAAFRGRLDLARLLVKHGAIDKPNNFGSTAADIAAQIGFHWNIEQSDNENQDLESVKPSAKLWWASRNGRLNQMQEFLKKGADPAVKISANLNAEEVAHFNGESEAAWYLNKYTEGRHRPSGVRPEMEVCKDLYGINTLMEIQRREGPTIINECNLNVGVLDLHFQDNEGQTLLHFAVRKNQLKEISLLLTRGAYPSAVTYDGVSPLELALQCGHSEAAQIILQHIDTLNEHKLKTARDQSRFYTILLSLISYSTTVARKYEDNDVESEREKQEVLKKASCLLSLGVPTEPPGNYDIQVLHLAITCNCKTILTLLLAAGAPLWTTVNGMGPVEIAWLTPDLTTWVGVCITRAVVNKLKSELATLLTLYDDESLNSKIEDLIHQLDGQKPWLAEFSCQEQELNQYLMSACKQGATLSAWWVWRAGASTLFGHGADGKTALHVALEEGQIATATVLIQHMGANPFLPDHNMGTSFDLFSLQKKEEIMKVCIVREYRYLDGILQNSTDSWQKRKALESILLFISLCLSWSFFGFKEIPHSEWQGFFLELMGFVPSGTALDNSEDLILVLIKNLKGISGERNLKTEAEGEKSDDPFLNELCKGYYTDDNITSDSLDMLIEVLEPLVKDFFSQSSKKISKSIPDKLLMKELLKCTQIDLPLYLHLLVSQAKVNPRVVLDCITKAKPIHLAACHGQTCSASYLLSSGASTSDQDIHGRTPAHFAYMYGHNELGNLLHTHPDLLTLNGMKPLDMRNAFHYYMSLYVDTGYMLSDEYKEVNNSSDLIKMHLEARKEIWTKQGFRESVQEAKVDYTKGEALEVKDTILTFLQNLMSAVGEIDPRYEAHVEIVGSSADDVRLLCPDEYDCNVIFKNFSGFPGQGCKILLKDLSQSEATHSVGIEVTTDRSELKWLFEDINLLVTFFRLIRKCLPKVTKDCRLAVTLPVAKLTQVGVAISLAWHGTQYPLLLIDVDVVPTMKAPCPSELKENHFLTDIEDIYLNTVGGNEWRCSFSQAENKIMKNLSDDERLVFLACKIILSSLKTEGWMPRDVKDFYKYWDQRKMKLPVPKGFLLKSSFFMEKQQVTDPLQWKEDKWLERMTAIFRRMCFKVKDKNRYVPGKVSAYFGQTTESPAIGYGAPIILEFLKEWQEISSRESEMSLWEATFDGNIKVIEKKIQEGSSLEEKDDQGDTLLHLGVKSCHVNALKILIEAGADVNATNNSGVSVLQHAIDEECWDAVYFLVEKGASIDNESDEAQQESC